MKSFSEFFKIYWIKTTFLILILILSINKIRKETKYYATGDAIEYTVMTEAFKNHLSSDIRVEDFESFKKEYLKNNKWEENDKGFAYDRAESFIAENNHKNLEYNYAFFVDKNGKKYATHFFFYSLLNIPVSWFCSLLNLNPLLAFMITNVVLIIISCFVFFNYSKFNMYQTALFVMLFFFSTNYWYMCWEHPEVFSVCFVSMGLWLFLFGKRYTGILLVSIAALQNQPIAIVSAGMCCWVLFEKGINFKNIFKTALSSCCIIIPSLFYYIHFGVTNLVKYQGALSFDYVTFRRVFGFFFDLNQGVILALPFILLLYIFLVGRKIIFIKKQKALFDILFLLAIIGSVCAASSIDNWNHGQAVVNRYVTYVSALILVHCFYLINEIENKNSRNIILGISLLTQVRTVFYHQELSIFDWGTKSPKPISNYVLTHFPSLYTPDPMIFTARYNPPAYDDPSQSPVYFMKDDGEITKLLVHQDYKHNLERFGLSASQVDSVYSQLSFQNKWAYVPVTEQLHKIISSSKMKMMDVTEKINHQIIAIKNDPKWYAIIKQKAIASGISEDEALRRDAAFVLGITIVNNETMQEKILKKVNEIKANAEWLAAIKEKAAKQNISLDSALMMDARWMIGQTK